MIELPDCSEGGKCELLSRDTILGKQGVAQCKRCSVVYEATGWRRRKCDHCGKEWGQSIHDPCLGMLEGVVQACCGHGDESVAYRLYVDGRREGVVR